MRQKLLDLNDRLLTIDEIADYLSVSRAWVYRAMNNGTLPYVTVGAHRRVLLSVLSEYLDLTS